MAVTSIMTTEIEITSKEGAGVSPDLTDGMHDAWVLQAENKVNVIARYNFSDAYAALDVDVKSILSDLVSSMVAKNGIRYDMGGYTNINEALAMLNDLQLNINENWGLLKDKVKQGFIVDPTKGVV